MESTAERAIAVVGIGAILPDAPTADRFWRNVRDGRYSVSDVTPDRWDPAAYYDPDPKAPDKTYSKIGGWVREWEWDPRQWGLPIPPRVSEAMDDGQKWAVACTHAVLADYGAPVRALDLERTAVILGNAMAGEKHYLTALRLYFPEFARELAAAPSFASLTPELREAIHEEFRRGVGERLPEISEDTMPGELSNCIAGRIANIFNMRGPNYVIDAACASAIAATAAAVEGLIEHDYDAVLTGGIDRNMGPSTYIKFCKIGALSASGTRPYADGADGFVMGEGAAMFLLKRFEDAEKSGDKIYAVVRGVGGSSDGKGKGITAPNPVGQRLAIQRAWRKAGLSLGSATLIEGHGTSTRVGDLVEVESLAAVFGESGLSPGSIALGSVKSNIGHLKAAAGAAGLLKAVLALHDKVLPPSLHFERPNPGIDFAHSPFAVNTELREWPQPVDGPRRAGVSAFGFGGTNFHAVLEEHVPGRLTSKGRSTSGWRRSVESDEAAPSTIELHELKAPLRGALVLGADSVSALARRVETVLRDATAGRAPSPSAPQEADLRAAERIAIDYEDAANLAERAAKAAKALATEDPGMWKVLRAQGIFRGSGPAPKVAFLYTGQGSQYVNMLQGLSAVESIVAGTFADADRVMTPLLGKPLTDFIFVNGGDAATIAQAEEHLRQTAITQPAVLAVDTALTRLLEAYGITPDFVMGHSLGEYGALVAARALPFADALEAVSARGREMTNLSIEDKGLMAAVFAPLADIERVLGTVEGYVVIANVNSTAQAVIGGATHAVERAIEALTAAGFNTAPLPVSHAFHTRIVAPASEPLRRTLERLHVQPPALPVVANLNGELYPMGPGVVPQMIDILAQQVASPVQFVKGLRTLFDAGARVFVEVGPKKALQGFVDDVLGGESNVVSLFTNHPKLGDVAAFQQALCGLYAAGLGVGAVAAVAAKEPFVKAQPIAAPATAKHLELGRLFAEFLERGRRIYFGEAAEAPSAPVVVTGAALGLPGTERVFDDQNVARILAGEQFIDVIPTRLRHAMVDKHITRLVKSDAGGTFETIDKAADVIKLAARAGQFDLGAEFGVAADRVAALDVVTRLAIAAGLDALRDAGIPLVMHYKTTSKGTQLPERWGLPEELRDDTGIVFASAFPGYDAFAGDLTRYHADRARRERLGTLEHLRARLAGSADGHDVVRSEVDHLIHELRAAIDKEAFAFDRRFLFRVLAMGHSQLAEWIGARGPNTAINAACASTTQAVALAEDWIRAGRCRRVLIVAGDDVTSDNLLEWMGAGFLATGAAATDEVVEDAATPFDRRRHGMLLGMGAAGIVIESAAAAAERGIRPICEVLGTVIANSAFHGTRLDVDHIAQVMETLVAQCEKRCGIDRREIAPQTVFVSHETYTPARGGSAAAEVHALRRVFGEMADRIVVANTKGVTGHPMGVGIEDVVAIKALETGLVPPVVNFKEVDPELGALTLSVGGAYPIRYALRLGAGFGSQISMTLMRWVPSPQGTRPSPDALGYASRIADAEGWRGWLRHISGSKAPELEVAHRTLRVKDEGVVARAAHAVVQPEPTRQGEFKPQPVAPVTAPSEVPIAGSADSVNERVLGLVAEKTGYPPDMLDLELDLEADLGIDTVKQAEVFAAIRAEYGIPRDDQLKLRDFPTLRHVIQFVHDRRPDREAAPATVMSPPPAPIAAADDSVKQRVLGLVAEKTGYPPDMLDLELDLEADLGIDTVKQAEVFAAIRAEYGIPRDDQLKLRDFPTLRHVIQFVHDRRPDREATPATVMSPPPAPIAAADDSVKQRVLGLVAEKTGYPPDMLDLELDLEADLGIDTVKQAEVFAAIRAEYGIPRDDQLKLRDFPTLRHVIQFVHDRRPDREAVASVSTTEKAPQPAAAEPASLDAANRVPRRVPVTMLRPPLEICKPTAVDLARGSRVIIMPDGGGVAPALVQQLGERGVESILLAPNADDSRHEDLLETARAAGSIRGVYWLPALDDEGHIGRMDLAAWHGALRPRVKLLYATLRALGAEIGSTGTFLVSATRLGGQHGYDEAGATAPLGGAVVGFTKAYKRERDGALVKAVDFEAQRPASEVAAALIAETLRDPGAVEVGYRCGERWTVGLEECPAADAVPGFSLGKQSVFVVTGAAGSIVSAIVADLAAASGGTFHLLDKIPPPDAGDADLARCVGDKENLKRELFERMKARGERATPALVEHELARLERARAALDAIESVRAAGGEARYHSVDLTDARAVAAVVDEVRRSHGRIDALIHAAGLEISRFLPDKQAAEFDLVFDVKSDGWFNLLRAIGDLPLAATVVFSSIAGRFGNAGQTDYSAANDLLCKLTSNLRRTRPETRGVAIDWTAWSGIGMASRGSIPKMMEAAGIDMLAPQAGIPVVRRELAAGTRGEVVIAERLGMLANEWDETGGLDMTAIDRERPMLGKILGMGIYGGLIVETTLDPASQPFLNDHRIDGVPVLPGVMGIEAFAELATVVLPGWNVIGVEDVNFLAPFKFYRGEPRTLTLEATFRPDGDSIVARCRLEGMRVLPTQPAPQRTTHFTACVRLARQVPATMRAAVARARRGGEVGASDIYGIYFHGPAYRVLDSVWREDGSAVGQMPQTLPADHQPPDRPLLAAPRLVELCFQTAGIWELGTRGRMALPEHVDRVAVVRTPEPTAGPLQAVIVPNRGGFDAEVVDGDGNVYVRVQGYRTVELPTAMDPERLAPLERAMKTDGR